MEALLPPFAERGAGGIARTGGGNATGGEWYWRLAIADVDSFVESRSLLLKKERIIASVISI